MYLNPCNHIIDMRKHRAFCRFPKPIEAGSVCINVTKACSIGFEYEYVVKDEDTGSNTKKDR